MDVTFVIDGLSAIVSDTEDIDRTSRLDVVMVDAKAVGAPAHLPSLDFLQKDLRMDDAKLVKLHPELPEELYRINLQDWAVRVVPQEAEKPRTAYKAVDLEYLPNLRRICGYSKIRTDSFDNPPGKPIATRIDLPFGDLECQHDVTREEWFFHPPVGERYCRKFAQEVHFVFAAKKVLFELTHLRDKGRSPARVIVEPSEFIWMSNEPADIELRRRGAVRALKGDKRDERIVEDDHTSAYYALLENIVMREPPRAWPNPGCRFDSPTVDGGIGCVPKAMTRS